MFKGYCLILIGKNNKTEEFLINLSKISELDKILDCGDILINTFICAFEKEEIIELSKQYNQNLFIFNIDSEDVSINLIDEDIMNKLIEPIKGYNIKEMNQRFIKTITEEPKFSYPTITLNKDLHDNYEHLDEFEKSFLVNELIDKGFSLLTEEEKMILRKLSNNN